MNLTSKRYYHLVVCHFTCKVGSRQKPCGASSEE